MTTKGVAAVPGNKAGLRVEPAEQIVGSKFEGQGHERNSSGDYLGVTHETAAGIIVVHRERRVR